MKINGKEINHYASKKLTFNRADGNSIELIVRSIPLGWQRKYEEVYPRPSAPTLVVATNASQDVKTNFTDPAFVKAISDWDKRHSSLFGCSSKTLPVCPSRPRLPTVNRSISSSMSFRRLVSAKSNW